MRGPTSVFYGQNIPGGMINLVTKRPTADPYHEASIEVGSRGLVGGRIDMSGPVNKDGTLFYRFTADSSSESTQTAFVQDKHVYVAPALTWKPNADTTFTLLSHFGYRDTGRANVDLPSVGTLYGSPFGRIGTGTFLGEPGFNEYKRTEEAIGYEFEHRFSDMFNVRQNLRYTHTHLHQSLVGDAGLEDDGQTLDRYAYKARASSNVFTVDNQAQFKFGKLVATLGVRQDWTSTKQYDNVAGLNS